MGQTFYRLTEEDLFKTLKMFGEAILRLKKENPNASDEKILDAAETILKTLQLLNGESIN